MKLQLIFVVLLMVYSTNSHSDTQREFPVLKGPLMGQKPPGMVAEPFAPGIISKAGWELEGVFAPGMQEFYFTTRNGNGKSSMVVGLRQHNNVWKKYIEFKRRGEVTFSPDGKRMHMAQGYKDRIGDGWSKLKSLGSPFEDFRIMRLTASSKGTYVFDEATRDGNGVIRYSRLINGKREAPRPFSKEINTGKWSAHPFIAPDESYIIWDSEREGGYGDSDLYISFRQQDGSWGSAINMGEQVNSPQWDAYATVTPDGKYILFNRGIDDNNENVDIYWVDAQIIETLRAKDKGCCFEENNGPAPEATAAQAKRSFRDIPDLKEAFIDAAPTHRKDGISVGELGVDGGNKTMIVKLAEEIADNKHGNYDSLLIAHKGKLLFESYYLRGRINLPHFQASATKAYTSLALGRAIQLGYLTMADLDKPLVSFLKDLDPTKFVEGVEKITLHKAMTMSSGLSITEEQLNEFRKNPDQLKGQGQVQVYLERSAPVSSESQKFDYKGTDPDMVMQVIEAVVPGTAQDFIKNEILDKMGIMNYGWRTNVSGLPEAGARAKMTSRDMVKWGTLVNNKGKWNGEQLISADFLAKATSGITQPTEDWQPETYRYGYFWYQTNIIVGDKSYQANLAWGGGGQHIIVLEELDLIIAITGHDREDTIMTQVSKNIIPAFAKDKFPVLEGPYIGQKPPGLTPKVFAPAIASTEYRDWGGSFTPDMKEYYFTRRNNKTGKSSKYVFKSENNRWYESAVDWGGFISPDGKTMYSKKKYRERTDDGWSELKSLGPLFEEFHIMRLTASLKGTYVFDERDEIGTIRYSRIIDGKREEPKKFGKEINTGKWTAHPFIAPDESYIIWDSEREGGYGDSDMYISFRQPDDSWGAAINFGDKINTDGEDGGGYVTPDGKYLFYCRRCSPPDFEIMWVDAQIIESLRPKESSFSSFIAANVEENNGPAPEATAAEVKLSFRDIPDLKEAFIDAAPTDKKDGIPVGELDVDGGNKDMIVQLAKEIAEGKHGEFDSLLIAHKGKLLFESYYLRGRINLPHFQASATKSYTGLALGRAIQLGYLTMADLDKPLISFLKDLDPTKFAEGAEKITLHQALTMTTGIRISDENWKKMQKNPRRLKGQGQVQALFEYSTPITAEAQVFRYSAGPQLVMQVIDAVVPGTAKDFIKNEFLGKMGITNYDWQTAVSGLPESGWKVSVTSRDMAKIGTLAMNKGRWKGEQLIPEAFITQAISRINYSGDEDIFGGGKDVSNQGYGYFWWSGDLRVGNKSYFAASAQGGGGQYIILIEELDLMVVVTAHDNDNRTLQIIAERILPAFIN